MNGCYELPVSLWRCTRDYLSQILYLYQVQLVNQQDRVASHLQISYSVKSDMVIAS